MNAAVCFVSPLCLNSHCVSEQLEMIWLKGKKLFVISKASAEINYECVTADRRKNTSNLTEIY